MKIPFALDALRFAAPLAAVAAVCLALGWVWAAVPFALATLTVLLFFRDPERRPADPDGVLAAADGVVTDIDTEWPGDSVLPAAQRVGIFLSVLDVHINRAPIDAEVLSVHHRPGKYFDARRPECSTENESNTLLLRRGSHTWGVKQISGAIARRIVCWARPGDRLERGQRFGLIRFGSRTEIYLPAGAEITVRVGERVRGGESVIARLAAEATP